MLEKSQATGLDMDVRKAALKRYLAEVAAIFDILDGRDVTIDLAQLGAASD